MRITGNSFRMIARTGLVLILASGAIAVVAAAQTQESCPPIIASLLPKNGSIRGGQYFAGDMGQGSGSADIPYENPCITDTKYPARISIAVTYYGGELVEIFKMQGDAAVEQALKNATSVLARTKITPKREKLGSGEIVYVEYRSACPPEGPATYAARVGEMIVPNVKLRGVARTDNVNLEVTLEGRISVDAAKAAVTEVFANLKQADFSKAK